jgi:hypothetical protein
MIQFELFIGNEHAFILRRLQLQLDDFLDLHFDRWYMQFVKFWASHTSLKPCTTKCTNAIIIDGHMKLKRRLCYNQTLPLVPPRPFELVFDTNTVGCPETLAYKSKFCSKCTSSSSNPITETEKKTRQKQQQTNSLSEVRLHLIGDSHKNSVFLIIITSLIYSYRATFTKRTLRSAMAT